ncbi:hypothetical protein Ct9H90mP12_1330 [bacterium]|nr:MAG: hypothetical protein Ct9H90mP12_1330 [bacterium]
MNKIDSSVQLNESILKRRWKKFKTLKRGYYSLIILSSLYGISFFLPFLINNRALVVKYHGEYFFPVLSGYMPGKQFGQDVPGDTRYRELKAQFIDKMKRIVGSGCLLIHIHHMKTSPFKVTSHMSRHQVLTG